MFPTEQRDLLDEFRVCGIRKEKERVNKSEGLSVMRSEAQSEEELEEAGGGS